MWDSSLIFSVGFSIVLEFKNRVPFSEALDYNSLKRPNRVTCLITEKSIFIKTFTEFISRILIFTIPFIKFEDHVLKFMFLNYNNSLLNLFFGFTIALKPAKMTRGPKSLGQNILKVIVPVFRGGILYLYR